MLGCGGNINRIQTCPDPTNNLATFHSGDEIGRHFLNRDHYGIGTAGFFPAIWSVERAGMDNLDSALAQDLLLNLKVGEGVVSNNDGRHESFFTCFSIYCFRQSEPVSSGS